VQSKRSLRITKRGEDQVNRYNVFKSEEGRDKIRGYYNKILSFFPFTQRYVDTSFGKTFVLEAGTDEYPAVILLHGSCSNSAAWLGDIPTLATQYHVFAVDLLGEAGNSEENRLDFNTDEYPRWLNEVMDLLGVEQAVIMGNSFGGWLALHFAAAFPNRTRALVLIAPSGIILPKASFLEQTEDILITSDRAATVSEALMGDAKLPKEVLEFMTLVMDNFNPVTEALPVLTDEQMCALTMPVLFIAGTNDMTMDSAQAAQRLSQFVSHAKVHLTDDAHVIMSSADTIMPFLTKELRVCSSQYKGGSRA